MPFIEQLLNGENVEWKKLGEVCSLIRGKRLTKRDLDINGIYPVYHGGIEPIGYYNQSNRKANSTMIINVGASAGTVGYSANDFWSSDGCFCFSHNEQLNQRYLYYSLQNIETFIKSKVRKAGIPTLDNKVLENIKIPLPPLSVQHKIVEILDKFTALEAELEANLEAELDCRKRQYEYYRNQLLSFDILNSGGQKLNDVKIMTLGDLGMFVRGSGLQKKDLTTQGIPAIHYGQIYTYYGTYAKKTKSFVTKEMAEKLKKVNYGDVIITNTSENIEDVCKAVVYLLKEQGVTGGHASIFKPSEKIIGKYLAYYTQTTDFAKEKRKFAKGTKVIDVNAKDLAKIKIPLPPLSVQREIVEILDKFDTLCNSISEGLPKEMELRRKQYEYYRNQLLTFAQ